MRDLHEELTALSVEWPATPDLAGAVAARLAQPAAPPRRRLAWRPALAYALAAIAAAFALTMAVSPDARSSVLEWLGLKSVEIERREPTAPPPQPGTLGDELGLGTPVTLAEARERSPFLSLPAGRGPRRARRDLPRRRQRLARLRRAPGLRPRQRDRRRAARAGVPGARRAVHREDDRRGERRLERLTIDGDPAFFITGAHGFAYEGDADVRFEEQRLAGNTLLVERADGLLIRVEGEIERDRAVAVARSIPRAAEHAPQRRSAVNRLTRSAARSAAIDGVAHRRPSSTTRMRIEAGCCSVKLKAG